jgi:hypothetical protein
MTRIAFVLDQFELQSPGQQLLDRFVIGYNQEGEFKRPGTTVAAFMPGSNENPLLQARKKEFRLEVAESIESALAGVDFVVIASGTKKFPEGGGDLERVMSLVPHGKPVYVDGALLWQRRDAELVVKLSRSRSIPVLSSRAAAHFVPLPVKPQFASSDVRKALIVAQGGFPEGELDALYALKPYLGSEWMRQEPSRVAQDRSDQLWDFAYSPAWKPLLEAAVSHSDNIKGDPDKDGRTQDVVGLRLLEKLAPNASGWHLEYGNRLQILVLMTDGAIADFNFAVEARAQIHSAQLYHPQAPMENHYDGLAAWILERLSKQPAHGNLEEALTFSRILHVGD